MNIIFQKMHRIGMVALAIVAAMSMICMQHARGAVLSDTSEISTTDTPATDSGTSNVTTEATAAGSSEASPGTTADSSTGSSIDDVLNQLDTGTDKGDESDFSF